MTIHKWKASLGGATVIEVPRGTEFLDVQVQKGQLVIWGLCEPGRNTFVRRLVVVYDTGTFVTSARSEYLGTVQLLGGDLIKHVFIQ